ncbi:hypothetical protein L9F63_025715, partial [Diploptera punctata]
FCFILCITFKIFVIEFVVIVSWFRILHSLIVLNLLCCSGNDMVGSESSFPCRRSIDKFAIAACSGQSWLKELALMQLVHRGLFHSL